MTQQAFNKLAGSLAIPMVVVTTRNEREKAGCLVGFWSQCSINPPLVTVWLSDKNHTTRVAAGAEHLAVHLLTEDDFELARLFGEQTGDEIDKFAAIETTEGPGGVPIINSCKRVFVIEVLQRQVEGDHIAHLGAVVDVSINGEARQLTSASLHGFRPGHEA